MTSVEPIPAREPVLFSTPSPVSVTHENPDERALAAALERACRDRIGSLDDELGMNVSRALLAERFGTGVNGVSGVDDITPPRAGLAVLNPTGLFFHENLPQSEEDHLPGTWHWPEGVL